MSLALVTGAAGFIGSHLCARLLNEGLDVRGVDNFDPYYPRELKERNLAPLRARSNFSFQEIDLALHDLRPVVDSAEFVFHEAARGGVRTSWGIGFQHYTQANILATQRLLEALRGSGVSRVIHASSSSVYGEIGGETIREDCALRPISPYGVSKLAAERLVQVYHDGYGVPSLSLRYFTVYGPGQRPDMAFRRFMQAILDDRSLEILGDGMQTRDFTFIDDVVGANWLAMNQGAPGRVYNIGGGSPASLQQVIQLLERIAGRTPRVRFLPQAPGDPRATCADTSRARAELGFRPTVTLEEGLGRMYEWMAAAAEARIGGTRASG
jgi:UDP-glucose 4-epimerase